MFDLYMKVTELIIEQIITQSGIIDYTLIMSVYIYRNALGSLIGIWLIYVVDSVYGRCVIPTASDNLTKIIRSRKRIPK